MKKPHLPTVMQFDLLGLCFFTLGEYRCPNRGEYYASGAIPEGYLARQHLTQEYWIVVPTYHARSEQVYKRGETVRPVRLPKG